MHPGAGGKAAEELVGLRHREYPGLGCGFHKSGELGMILWGEGDVLPLRPAAGGNHLEEGQLLCARAAGQIMKGLQMMHIPPAQDDIEVDQKTGIKRMACRGHGLGEDPLSAAH